jgi:hypothetical protein
LRSIERLAGMDRKTVRRYVAAAVDAGVERDGGEGQLDDVVLASICEKVRPHRPDGRGAAWGLLATHHEVLKGWLVDDGLTVVKAGELLARRGTVVPERTLHRYALEVIGVGRSARRTTVRVADGEPGHELQVDFGKMGLIDDPDSGRRRVVQALIFTAVFSRHCFVRLSFTQTAEAVIAGCEAAWAFFGGIFKVLIPDNMSSVIDKANPTESRFNEAFVEYAQARGFLTIPDHPCAQQVGGDTYGFDLIGTAEGCAQTATTPARISASSSSPASPTSSMTTFTPPGRSSRSTTRATTGSVSSPATTR